jgi:hypothetical protein
MPQTAPQFLSIVIEINKCHLLLKHTICPFPTLIPTLCVLHELFPSTTWAQHSPFIKSLTEIAYIFENYNKIDGD